MRELNTRPRKGLGYPFEQRVFTECCSSSLLCAGCQLGPADVEDVEAAGARSMAVAGQRGMASMRSGP